MEIVPNPSPPVTAEDLSRFRSELVADIRAAVASKQAAPIPFARFQAEFLDMYRPPLRARATFVKLRQVLGHLAELVGPDGTTGDLTTDLVVRFIESRPIESPGTTRGLLNVVRTICNHCASQGTLGISPFALRKRWVRGQTRKADKVRHHTLAEIGSVLALAARDVERKVPGSWAQWRARRTYALVATVAYTGMRKGEALHLRIEDIHFESRMLLIVSREHSELKTPGSAQPVPMTEALASILAAWVPHLAIPADLAAGRGPLPERNPAGTVDGGWLFPNAARTGPWVGGSPGWKPLDRIRRLGERLGIPDFTYLSLRHSWATHGESAWGFSEAFMQRILRHTTTLTQRHYRHVDAANLRAGIAAVSFGTEAAPAAELPPVNAVDEVAGVNPPTTPRRGSLDPKNPSRPGVWNGRKLEPQDVLEARELRARGWTYSRLQARYHVSKSTLSALFNGLTHRDV